MEEEQRGDDVAGAVSRRGEPRRAHEILRGAVGRDDVDVAGRRLVHLDRSDEDRAGASHVKKADRRDELPQVDGVVPDEAIELEMVRRDDLGERDGALAEELRYAPLDEHPAAAIADHRIAAIDGAGIGGFDPADRTQNGRADLDRADVSGEHAVAACEHATLGDALDHRIDHGGSEHLALPSAVAGVIGELHGMHRPDLAAEPLQREHRGRIADMPIGDVRLDGEDVHAGTRQRATNISPSFRGAAQRNPESSSSCRFVATSVRKSGFRVRAQARAPE